MTIMSEVPGASISVLSIQDGGHISLTDMLKVKDDDFPHF